MSSLQTFFYLIAVALLSSGQRYTIWESDVDREEDFTTSGTVDFGIESTYCTDICVVIRSDYSSSYAQTIAIDTTGYEDIFISFSYAVAAGWSTNYCSFHVYYFTDPAESDYYTLINLTPSTSSAYNVNALYSCCTATDEDMEHAANAETLYIRFEAWTTDSNIQGWACVDNIAVEGTEMPTTTTTTGLPSHDPSTSPSTAPTPAPSSSPTPKPTDHPTDIPSRAPIPSPTQKPTETPTKAPTEVSTFNEHDTSQTVASTETELSSQANHLFPLIVCPVCSRIILSTDTGNNISMTIIVTAIVTAISTAMLCGCVVICISLVKRGPNERNKEENLEMQENNLLENRPKGNRTVSISEQLEGDGESGAQFQAEGKDKDVSSVSPGDV